MTAKKRQLAHLFDATQCIGCGACVIACSETNYPEMRGQSNPGWNWPASNIRQIKIEKNRPLQVLVQCQQCSDAPCVRTCPFGANYYDEDGWFVSNRSVVSAVITVLLPVLMTSVGLIRCPGCRQSVSVKAVSN